MGSSSGSGSLVFGGSLSSSTLSPLAPPFNFDKTYQKPNLTNPSVNLFEGPAYSSVFDPVGPFWNSTSSPSASVPSYVGPDSTGANTSCPTSPGIYSYQVPPYTGPGVTCDPFSYTHFQNSVPTSVDQNAKPYYPPYVHPPPVKDGCVELGGVKGPGYDFLSNSDTVNCIGFGSPSIDRTQRLSVDGDPKPKWGDFCIGVNDGDHSEWKKYPQGYGSQGNSFFGLSGDKSHLPVDGSSQIHPFSETKNECLLKQGSHISQGLDCCPQNVSTDSASFYDIFGGGYPALSLGIGQQDYHSAFDLKLGGISAGCSKLPPFASVSTSDEIPHLQKPVLESVTSFCGPQTTTLINDCSSQTGSFVFNCSSTTGTHISGSKLPYGGSKFTAQSTHAGTKTNHSDVVHKSTPFTGSDSSSQKEPQIPPGLKSRSSIVIKRPLSSLMGVEPSSTQIGGAGNRSVKKDASDKPNLTPIVPRQFNLDGFSREVDDAEVILSADKHTGEGDVHTSAEDSPCWKGASSTRFSPFGVSDSLVSNTQGTPRKTSRVDSHSVDLSAEDINESISVKRPPSTCTLKDNEDSSLMSQKPHLFDLNDGAEVEHDNEYQVSIEKSNERKARIADKNKDPIAEAYVSSRAPFVIGDGLCSSPSGDKSSFEFCQSLRKVSDSSINISMRLKTMLNISEELRTYCLNNPDAAMQQHSNTIRHIIDNLSNCKWMTDAPLLVSSQGSSYQKKLPVSEMVSTSESAAAAAAKLSWRTEEFLESFPFKDDPIILRNDNVEEAKKILVEYIKEGEMEQHELPYKNLWLEAEAALCAMTVKARLLHMKMKIKMEMEKACASTKEVGKPPGSGISSHVQSFRESTTSKDKDSPALVVHDCSSRTSTTTTRGLPTSQVSLNSSKCDGLKSTTGDICDLPSVTARYQILRDRIDPFDSCGYEGQLYQGEEDNCLLEKDNNSSLENSHANVEETSALARYHIVKCRDDKADSLNNDCNQSSKEFDLSDTDRPFQNPNVLNSFSGTDDVEASVMGRFRILQNRVNCLNAMEKGPTPEQSRMPATTNDATQGKGWTKQVGQSFFGPYPDFTKWDISANREVAETQAFKVNNLSSKIVEDWYVNGYLSSEWEHVSKEDLQRQL